jgi:hypothetical protein
VGDFENSEIIWVEIEFPNYKVVTLQSADIKTGSNKVPLPVF